jgi:glycerophosphoryl diester phosphodiesterase
MQPRPVVIAHRGASGYLPEHTLVAKALAYGMGADYLEQDVIATRDGELVVFHDLMLELTTDVATCFPGRHRADGHFYCIDFTFAELQTLSVVERRAADGTGRRNAGRFPDGAGRFRIPTLEEELLFIRGLNRSTGRDVGIYPEIKDPAWHRAAGIELADRMIEVLARCGYDSREERVFVQCFDPGELARLRGEGCRMPLVQLIDSSAPVPTRAELVRIASYADAIGPSLSLVWKADRKPATSTLVADAHAAGLAVHPYTIRKDDLPAGVAGMTELLDIVLGTAGADGVFTDFPDIAAAWVARHHGGAP